ncbi:hypothetical protein cyc_03653 [Cyclospora cayetanensis]|uniref:Uncharacterized protein n=1 Tax=Cyclospora cayetanensis TaxID=88456 RepID=A0A1D3D0M0_9EIME|nr:hypothetical protein cyc_03653 [Cyclospora cayetanensis]
MLRPFFSLPVLQLEKENAVLKAQLSIKTQLLSGEVHPEDMPAIELELQKEHEQLLRDKEHEMEALRKELHRLDTLVTELKQKGLLSRLFTCSCMGAHNEDSDATEVVFE